LENITDSSLYLHQEDFINELLKEYPYEENIQPDCPLTDPNSWKVNPNEIVHKYPYRKIIGSHLYLSNNT